MKLDCVVRAHARALLGISGVLGIFALSANVTGNGLLVPDALNMQLLGHNDLQGRVAYQPTLQTQNGRVILYVGHFAGTMFNPLTGVNETNGTSLVDVTSPSSPVYLRHITGNGSQMVRVCAGLTGTLGTTGHYYMLRNNGGNGGKHEVWDTTDPLNPILLSTPLSGLTATHKSWWECDTGIAYIVAGAGPTATTPDGWTTNQHIKIFDLSDPANPVYIRDIGLVGQNPGSSVTTATSGVHGPISVRNHPINGTPVNRIYIPYGTSSNGVFQIVDRLKVLPVSKGGTWDGSRPVAPTDADLRAIVVGSMDMTPSEGAHTSFPVYGVPLRHYQGFTSNTTRDLVALISEEVDNHCNGSPHFGYLVDATRTAGAGGASPGEQHPMVISTMQVFEDIAKPDYCTRGTRFGPHSTNESFYAPYYGKLLFIAYFDGGARVFDIRDPYHPQDVAHYVPAINAFTQPTVVAGVTYFDVSSDNLELDDNGLIYDVDRVGGGVDILMLTGPAALIPSSP